MQNATLSKRKRLLTATVDEPFVTDQRVTALRPKVAFYLAIQPGLQAIPRHVNACGPDGGRPLTVVLHGIQAARLSFDGPTCSPVAWVVRDTFSRATGDEWVGDTPCPSQAVGCTR